MAKALKQLKVVALKPIKTPKLNMKLHSFSGTKGGKAGKKASLKTF